jgi:hypothetical protein
MTITAETLNQAMEFDCPVRIHPDGNVTVADDAWAPELHDGQLADHGWILLDGYSGQYGYSGPIMHPSEYIGGRMARDILARPGLYVTLVAEYSCEECLTRDDCQEDHWQGWAVAFRPTEDTPED